MIWRKYEARVGSCGGNANLANIHLPCGNVFPNFLAPLIRVCGLDCWSQGSFEGSLIAFLLCFSRGGGGGQSISNSLSDILTCFPFFVHYLQPTHIQKYNYLKLVVLKLNSNIGKNYSKACFL